MSKEVMNKNELHEYGINLMISYLEKNNFTIMETNMELGSCPQIIAQKGNDMSFIIVETFMFPKKNVSIDSDTISFMKETAKNYNAKCYVAKVGLANAEAVTKGELSKAYKNSDFLVKFNGLQEV